MEEEGKTLVKELEKLITDKRTSYPQIEGKTAAFFYFTPTDLGKFYVYLPVDPRASYLLDLGFTFPESVLSMADETSFALELSAENIDLLMDVEVIVTYGDENLLEILRKDALLGTVPAIKNGAVAILEDGTPIAASSTPSALSIPANIDEYFSILGEAADKVQ